MKMKNLWRNSAGNHFNGDPLEEAIARVQELEEQLKAQVEETSKKEQDLLLRTRAEMTICVVVANKMLKKRINLH